MAADYAVILMSIRAKFYFRDDPNFFFVVPNDGKKLSLNKSNPLVFFSISSFLQLTYRFSI